MKVCFLTLFTCLGLFLNCRGVSLTDAGFVPELPVLPQAWDAILGRPYWRIEWINEDGRKETATVVDGGGLTISPPQTWPSAVYAFPFWPQKGIGAGLFKPAGAIFPYDVSGKSLILSWQGGVDAFLYWEMAAAYGAVEGDSRAVARQPQNFNWPRFRQLFSDPSLNADVRADPWLADWRGIAAKIVQSGFDKRRLVPQGRNSLTVPVGPGPWIGTSPFAAPLFFEAVPVFPVRPDADTWVSGEGLLRCNSQTWILIHLR